MKTKINLSLDRTLKDDFYKTCHDQYITPSTMLRVLMMNYIKEQEQADKKDIKWIGILYAPCRYWIGILCLHTLWRWDRLTIIRRRKWRPRRYRRRTGIIANKEGLTIRPSFILRKYRPDPRNYQNILTHRDTSPTKYILINHPFWLWARTTPRGPVMMTPLVVLLMYTMVGRSRMTQGKRSPLHPYNWSGYILRQPSGQPDAKQSQ